MQACPPYTLQYGTSTYIRYDKSIHPCCYGLGMERFVRLGVQAKMGSVLKRRNFVTPSWSLSRVLYSVYIVVDTSVFKVIINRFTVPSSHYYHIILSLP